MARSARCAYGKATYAHAALDTTHATAKPYAWSERVNEAMPQCSGLLAFLAGFALKTRIKILMRGRLSGAKDETGSGAIGRYLVTFEPVVQGEP
jgi:hypothetical protein